MLSRTTLFAVQRTQSHLIVLQSYISYSNSSSHLFSQNNSKKYKGTFHCNHNDVSLLALADTRKHATF